MGRLSVSFFFEGQTAVAQPDNVYPQSKTLTVKRLRQEDGCKSEARLIYIVSSRLLKATEICFKCIPTTTKRGGGGRGRKRVKHTLGLCPSWPEFLGL